MARAGVLALGCLLGSCTVTHSADDFSTCDEQCPDFVAPWSEAPTCAAATVEAVKACRDSLCVAGMFTVIPDGPCSTCLFSQLVDCARVHGCRCEWEAYSCCYQANACSPAECEPCNGQGLDLLDCAGDIGEACGPYYDVCSIR